MESEHKNSNAQNTIAMERDIKIDGVAFHVKSVFEGSTTLKEALYNIISTRLLQ